MEEKLNRLEQERAELMVTIQKGEGFDTAIQQLQQDNVSKILCSLILRMFNLFHYNFSRDCKKISLKLMKFFQLQRVSSKAR